MTAQGDQAPAEETAAGVLERGVQWSARPAHARALRRAHTVLTVALRQLRELPAKPHLVQDPTLELWRLREPGFLRDLVEQPPVRVSGVRVLVPVLATWVLLGFFEWRYIEDQAGIAPAERTPFFTRWMDNVWYLSPVGLSVVVVISVLLVMAGYWRAGAAQRVQDEFERQAEDFEPELLPSLALLREQYLGRGTDDVQQAAAEAVWAAARELRGAAETLGGSVGAAADLRVVLDRLLDRLPEVGEQAARLGTLTARFEEAAEFVAEEAQPLLTLVNQAGNTATALDHAMTLAAEMVQRARDLSEETHRSNGTVDLSREPLVVASRQVQTAVERMDALVASLGSVADALNEAVQRANWISLVADGLRAGDYGASHNGGPRATA